MGTNHTHPAFMGPPPAGARTASAPVDPDAVVTPSDLRAAVVGALEDRIRVGHDMLAPGCLKVIKHLERQANALAWKATGQPYEHGPWSHYDEHCEAAYGRATPCPVFQCPYCAEEAEGK